MKEECTRQMCYLSWDFWNLCNVEPANNCTCSGWVRWELDIIQGVCSKVLRMFSCRPRGNVPLLGSWTITIKKSSEISTSRQITKGQLWSCQWCRPNRCRRICTTICKMSEVSLKKPSLSVCCYTLDLIWLNKSSCTTQIMSIGGCQEHCSGLGSRS